MTDKVKMPKKKLVSALHAIDQWALHSTNSVLCGMIENELNASEVKGWTAFVDKDPERAEALLGKLTEIKNS